MLDIYMDESGFTGEDLLNAEQPVFVHVSTTLSDAECDALFADHFAGTQGHELKHKNLGKNPSGQARIAGFIKVLHDTGKCTAFVCHKEFTALTYLVDLWVEPAMHQDGLDLYKDGGNLALCNMSYYCLRTFQSDRFLREHLRRFQRMMIQRTPESYLEFVRKLQKDYRQADQRTKEILTYFIGGVMKLGFGRIQTIPKRALDPALTTAVQTCSHWRQTTDTKLRLIHDQSSSLAKDRWLWDMITSPDMEQKTIGIPGRETVYPLNVAETAFADSRSHRQLQFCDLIAGATAAWCRQFLGLSHDAQYVARLGEAGIEGLRIGGIWPQAAVDPETLGMQGWSGENIDFMAEQLAKLAKKPGNE